MTRTSIERYTKESGPNVTSSFKTRRGGPHLTLDQRLASLEADPEMASLNMGTMVRLLEPYKGTQSYNPPWEIERFAQAMLDRDIRPEMEVYNPSMFRDVTNLIQKGLMGSPTRLTSS